MTPAAINASPASAPMTAPAMTPPDTFFFGCVAVMVSELANGAGVDVTVCVTMAPEMVTTCVLVTGLGVTVCTLVGCAVVYAMAVVAMTATEVEDGGVEVEVEEGVVDVVESLV